MEPVGMAISIASLAGAATSCIKLYNAITASQKFGVECEVVLCKLEVEQVWFTEWIKGVGLWSPTGIPEKHHHKLDNEQVKSTVFKVLVCMETLFGDVHNLKTRYGLQERKGTETAMCSGQLSANLQVVRDVYVTVNGNAKQRQENASLYSRARWVIEDHKKFNALIEQLRSFNVSLDRLVPDVGQHSEQRIQAEILKCVDKNALTLLVGILNNHKTLQETASSRLNSLQDPGRTMPRIDTNIYKKVPHVNCVELPTPSSGTRDYSDMTHVICNDLPSPSTDADNSSDIAELDGLSIQGTRRSSDNEQYRESFDQEGERTSCDDPNGFIYLPDSAADEHVPFESFQRAVRKLSWRNHEYILPKRFDTTAQRGPYWDLKEYPLENGKLMTEVPINPSQGRIGDDSDEDGEAFADVGRLRFVAVTCESHMFRREGYTLRCAGKRPAFLVAMEVPEDDIDGFEYSLYLLWRSLDYEKQYSSSYNPNNWPNVVLCFYSSSPIDRLSERTFEAMEKIGLFRKMVVPKRVNGKTVTTHLFENTAAYHQMYDFKLPAIWLVNSCPKSPTYWIKDLKPIINYKCKMVIRAGARVDKKDVSRSRAMLYGPRTADSWTHYIRHWKGKKGKRLSCIKVEMGNPPTNVEWDPIDDF